MTQEATTLFRIKCPHCGKTSFVCTGQPPEKIAVNCGDCLWIAQEVVRMTVWREADPDENTVNTPKNNC